MIEAARVHPHTAGGGELPPPSDRDGQEMATEAPPDELGHQTEVRHLDIAAVLLLELEVAGGASTAPGDPRLDLRTVEPRPPALVRPREPPRPIPVATDRGVQEPVQLGLHDLGALDREGCLRRVGRGELCAVTHLQRPGRDLDCGHAPDYARCSSAERWCVSG